MKKIILIFTLFILMSCEKDNQINLTPVQNTASIQNVQTETIQGRVYGDSGYPLSDVNIALYKDGDTIYCKTDVNGYFILDL